MKLSILSGITALSCFLIVRIALFITPGCSPCGPCPESAIVLGYIVLAAVLCGALSLLVFVVSVLYDGVNFLYQKGNKNSNDKPKL